MRIRRAKLECHALIKVVMSFSLPEHRGWETGLGVDNDERAGDLERIQVLIEATSCVRT